MKLTITFWTKIKKLYSPCLVSVVHSAYFIVFLRGFEVFIVEVSADEEICES